MKTKLSSLDTVRALACIGIFTFHTYISMLGCWAVSAFIMLSGFVLSYNAAGKTSRPPLGLKDSLKYALKKIRKLYPLYFLTLLALALRLIILGRGSISLPQLTDLAGKFIACALLLQSWISLPGWSFALNGVGWYLSTILLLYFFFPSIMRGIVKLKTAKATLFAAAAVYVLMLVIAGTLKLDSWHVYIFPPYRLLDFSIGCLLGYLFTLDTAKNIRTPAATVLELTGLALAYISSFLFNRGSIPGGFASNALFVIPNALLIYSFALNKGVISKVLDCGIMRFISDHSGEIFLIHPVIIAYLTPVLAFLPLKGFVSEAVFVVLAIAGTLAATLLYRRFSRRFPFFAVR